MATQLTIIPNGPSAGGCACCAAATADPGMKQTEESSVSSENENTVTVYTVTGMTCGHCVASVTEEVGALDGVSAVDVDLATGKVAVTSAAPLAEADVRAAVGEAGYQLVA